MKKLDLLSRYRDQRLVKVAGFKSRISSSLSEKITKIVKITIGNQYCLKSNGFCHKLLSTLVFAIEVQDILFIFDTFRPWKSLSKTGWQLVFHTKAEKVKKI